MAASRRSPRDAWRRTIPGSDPDRAADLLAPVAAARQAVIYRRFLDNIEASEQAYHRADVPDWLARTAAILRADSGRAASRVHHRLVPGRPDRGMA